MLLPCHSTVSTEAFLKEGLEGFILFASNALTCLTLLGDVRSPQGALEHRRVGKEPSREGMKVSRGLSRFLKINGLVRERDFKSCKVTLKVSRDLDPFKCCTLNRPAGPVSRAGPTRQGVEQPFPVAQKPICSPHPCIPWAVLCSWVSLMAVQAKWWLR